MENTNQLHKESLALVELQQAKQQVLSIRINNLRELSFLKTIAEQNVLITEKVTAIIKEI